MTFLRTQDGIYLNAIFIPGYLGLWSVETNAGILYEDVPVFKWLEYEDILSGCGKSRVRVEE